jgi:hypothetical protein
MFCFSFYIYVSVITSNDTKKRVASNAAPFSLQPNMRSCGNGEVISKFAFGDGYSDCSDNSDEVDCGKMHIFFNREDKLFLSNIYIHS